MLNAKSILKMLSVCVIAAVSLQAYADDKAIKEQEQNLQNDVATEAKDSKDEHGKKHSRKHKKAKKHSKKAKYKSKHKDTPNADDKKDGNMSDDNLGKEGNKDKNAMNSVSPLLKLAANDQPATSPAATSTAAPTAATNDTAAGSDVEGHKHEGDNHTQGTSPAPREKS